MSELVAEAWRDGVGVDDREALEQAAAAGGPAEVALFAALCRQLAREPAQVPTAPPRTDAAVVHAAWMLGEVTRTGTAAQMTTAVAALEDRLAALDDADPHATAAHAWADLALGELAILVGDHRVARQRFEEVARPERPVALRVHALLELAALAIGRCDLEAARAAARKATASVDAARRPRQAARAALVSGLLDYAVGDLVAMRGSLGDGAHGPIARLLLATAEPSLRGMQILSDLIRSAVADQDPLTYALCVLVGARRYVALGHADDAIVVLDAAIAQLVPLAPHLTSALDQERREIDRVPAGSFSGKPP